MGLFTTLVKPTAFVAASSRTRETYAADKYGRVPVSDSDELQRVLALPRRPIPSDTEQLRMAAVMTARLRRDNPVCRCAELRPGVMNPCITHLLPIQGWYLYEAAETGGAVGHIEAGGGKTGINFLLPMVFTDCKRAVLLIEAKLMKQTLNDYDLWRQHFTLPNLAGGPPPFVPNRPTLEVLTYSKLSHESTTTYLMEARPNLIIADEGHNLKDPFGVRGGRFLYYYDEAERKGQRARLCTHSGTLAKRSIMDYVHLNALALGQLSPTPLDPGVAKEWAGCLDPLRPIEGPPTPPGALMKLTTEGESVRAGYCRRLIETEGVITTEAASLPVKLVLRARKPKSMPEALRKAVARARREKETPGDEPLEDPAEIAACCSQLVCGFYYRTTFPRGESEELILSWYAARKKWHREVRERMEADRMPMLDSPELLQRAAERAASGYAGPLPVWHSRNWEEWRDIQTHVVPVQETVWLDDYLVEDAMQWARDNGPGCIWYSHVAFAKRLAELSRFPLYDGGTHPESEERGDRTILCSIDAHATGKNMQQFCRALIANPQGQWEQLLARHHRAGQAQTVVTVDLYTHTSEFTAPLEYAVEEARFTYESTRKNERLLYAEKIGLTW